MALRRILLVAATVCAAPSLAVAEDVCAKILNHGLNNIAIAGSEESLANQLYWRFCDEKRL